MYAGIKPQRKPKNNAEAQFYEMAESKRWVITKKGFPDYACFLPNGDFILVEVKGARSHRLRSWQWKVMEQLSKLGIKCYRWSPDTGFTRIGFPEEL